MIFISYYTKDTPYEKVIQKYLLPSLQRWKLKYDIEEIKDFGDWQKNTHYKAIFIKKMLLKHKESIVFLDADASIEEYPLLLLVCDLYYNYDIALHYLDWFLLWRKQRGNPKREALSGTLYLRYNKKTLQFLDEWIEENRISTDWEQRNMQKILMKWTNKLSIYDLPPEYCTVILQSGEIPFHYLKEKPIIIHHQVSRQYKNRDRY